MSPSDAVPLALSLGPDGVSFWIHVSPGARRAGIGGLHADALRVAVRAPASGGRANTACLEALARALDVPKRDVRLDPGSRHRRKRVRVVGPPDALQQRLLALAAREGLR